MGTTETSEVQTVADVLARLEAIDRELPASDGVKWFNKLYLEVTQAVASAPMLCSSENPSNSTQSTGS